MKKPKQNLVIVHSFPTNSLILKGFYDFLRDYFAVYPIDLPGFIRGTKPLKNIELENYAQYVKKEIKKLKLESYWIAGVSFGFVVVNLVKDKKHCKGILAIEPYLGTASLNLSISQKMLFVMMISVLRFFNIFYRAWHSEFFQGKFLFGSSANINEKIKKYLNEIDARTFFETAKILLVNKNHGCFLKSCPYVLVINKHDGSVLADRIIRKFKAEAPNLSIIHTTAAHFPKDMSKAYFRKNIQKGEIKKMLEFMEEC
jgi:pimeloyl-ACP methyl ester carboxylesterase